MCRKWVRPANWRSPASADGASNTRRAMSLVLQDGCMVLNDASMTAAGGDEWPEAI